MKVNSCKKAAILATVLSGFLWNSGVQAANLAAITVSNYSQSVMGSITGSFIKSDVAITPHKNMMEDLNGDPGVYNVVDAATGESSLFLRQYTYSIANLTPGYYIPAQGDWGNKDKLTQGVISQAPNPHNAAKYNDYIYIVDYDLGTLAVGHIEDGQIIDKKDYTKKFIDDLKNNEHLSFAPKCQMHGEGITINKNGVYVVVNVNPTGGYNPYEESFLIHYDINKDGSLSYESCAKMGKNTDSVTVNAFNDNILVTAIGGYQNYGEANKETSINFAKTSPTSGHILESRPIKIPSNVTSEFRSMKVLPNGTAYIMTYNIGSTGNNIDVNVYKTTVSNLVADKPVDWEKIVEKKGASGWFGKLNAEYYTKRLWLQIGNELHIYTDGATEPIIYKTSDFSDNPAYQNMYTWDVIKSDMVSGDLGKLSLSAGEGLTTPSVTTIMQDNPDFSWASHEDYGVGILGTVADTAYADVTKDNSNYKFDKDTLISIDNKKIGNLYTNVLAGINASDGNDININAGTNVLKLQVDNTTSNPTGIYAGNGKNITVNAGKLNIITKGMEGGNSLTNAIWLDAAKDKSSEITINAPVNISMVGGYGGNAIAIQKTDRWGEKSTEASVGSNITITGDVNIKGSNDAIWGIPVNKENVLSRFNSSGILTGVDKSSVTINGDVDFTVYGNGVTALAKDSIVTINGGGRIIVPTGMNYGYYALAAYEGTVNMNTGVDGITPGQDTVQLNGDLFALNTGNINVALTTEDSSLNGIIDNGGTVNLWLQNGAEWNNIANNHRYKQDNEDVGNNEQSRVTNFYGGSSAENSGVIYQKADSHDLTIDNYTGFSKVIYNHDASDPTKILGGDIKIGNAATGSQITLRTDYDSNMTDATVQQNVLNSLANKLYYNAYINNQKNLNGIVEIAEGLTASSAAKYTGNIIYDKTTGQGALDQTVTPQPPTPPIPPEPQKPTEQVKNSFTTSLTGDYVNDKEYQDGGVLLEDNNKYNFNKFDTTITTEGSSIATDNKNISLNMNKHSLNLTAQGTAIAVNGGKVDINDVKNIAIIGKEGSVDVQNGGTVNIHNSGKVTADSNVNVAGSGTGLTVDGAAEIKGALKADGGQVTLKDAATVIGKISAVNNGSVTINGEKKAVDVLLQGGMEAGEGGKITANLMTEDSELQGDLTGSGKAEVTLQHANWNGNNSADLKLNASANTWIGNNSGKLIAELNNVTWNGDNSGNMTMTMDNSQWTGNNSGTDSHVTMSNEAVWTGSNSASGFELSLNNATWKNKSTSSVKRLNSTKGIIDMTAEGAGDISVDNYSGSSIVIYSHNAENPTKINGGNFTVKNAASDSNITLRTDSVGIDTTDEDSINSALNALANKLYYTGFVTGENNLKGYVQIAEGLTASSVTKQAGDIAYDKTTGQGSLDKNTVTPGPSYPEEQVQEQFSTTITGEYQADKEYRKAGVLTADDQTYRFTKGLTNITTVGNTVDVVKNITIDVNNNSLELLSNNGIGILAHNNDVLVDKVNNITISGAIEAMKADGGKITINNKGLATINGDIDVANQSSITIAGNADIKGDLNAVQGNLDIDGATSINGNIIISNQGKINIANGKKITGNITNDNGLVNLTLDGKDSKWTGNYKDSYDTDVAGVIGVNLTLNNGAVWDGNAEGTMNIIMDNNAVWNGQSTSDDTVLNLKDGAVWNVKEDSQINTLNGADTSVDSKDKAGYIKMSDANLNVDSYSGSTVVVYNNDPADPTNIKGGDLTIKNAAAGSEIKLVTDRQGLKDYEDKSIANTLNALADKIFYTGFVDGENNLQGSVELAEGLTASSAGWQIGDLTFDKNNHGQGNVVDGSIHNVNKNPEIIYGSKETAMMRGAKSAMISTAMMWRSEANDVLQRMGELRMPKAEAGVWARYYGGKYEMDSQNTNYTTSYKAYQVGYDKKINDNWIVGVAASYNDSDSSYDLGGKGDGEIAGLSVYGTMQKDDGSYLDLVFKGGRLKNEYTVYNDMGHELNGDYSTWAASISAEYGKLFTENNGFYFAPSVQLTMGHVAGKDYKADSDFLAADNRNKQLAVSQDAYNSMVGKIGFTLGRQLNGSSYYAKLALAHEFGNDFTTTFAAENEPTSQTTVDFGDTWYEARIGGSMKLSDNSLLFADYQRSFGGDVEEKWRVDAGLKFTF